MSDLKNKDYLLLKLVSLLYGLIRCLYLSGKISRDDWLDLTDEIIQFLQEEI